MRGDGTRRYRHLMVRPALRRRGRLSGAQVVSAVASCLGTVIPSGGDCLTARPARGSGQARSPNVPARPRKRRAGSAMRRDHEEDMNAYVKKVVDALPPLTDEQRDLLALIFRRHQHP